MIPNMIDPTPYDVRWRMFGTHIRVHPLFWVISAVFSYDLLQLGIQWLLLGMLCIFLSILLHEFGHVFASRCFGVNSHIVLWAFGGLAIPDSREPKRWQRIIVFAAGPGIQLLLWLGLYFLQPYIMPLVLDGTLPAGVYVIFLFLMFINLYWALLNLVPIWPLDGGQISREVFTYFSRDNGIRLSLHLSMGISALLAIHAFLAHAKGGGIPYLPVGIYSGVFFVMFFMTGLQALQMENARDNWHDRRWD
jgi:stage IV sporulation protein FB